MRSPRGPYRASAVTLAHRADARERLIDAAREIVAQEGYRGLTIAAAATRAGLAVGSVYRHFPSKSSLFSEMLQAVCDRELAVIRAIAGEPGRSPLDRIGDCVTTFADRALRGEGLAYAVIVEPMDPDVDQVRLEARARLAGVFTHLIDEGIAAGELGPQDARVRGAAIVGAFLEAIVAPLAHRAEVAPDRHAIAAEIALFCQAAVSGTEGSAP